MVCPALEPRLFKCALPCLSTDTSVLSKTHYLPSFGLSGRIILSENESDAHWQQNDYKGFSPNVDWDTVDFKKSPAIQELPVISAICEPAEGQKVKVVDGKIRLRGRWHKVCFSS